MGVSIPDSSILMRGLSRIMKKFTGFHPELNFRLSLVRNALLVDIVPTLQSVTQYSEHLLAELEQMGHHAKRKEPTMDAFPKVKKLEEGPRSSGKPGEELEKKKKPCRLLQILFLADSGCKRGRNCGQRRCWPLLKPFRISKLCSATNKGLLDPGATHPLRAKFKHEDLQYLPKVTVTLAGDKEVQMALTPTGVIVRDIGTEPIVPMGLLATVLGCEISWGAQGVKVVHPQWRELPV
eukprot:s116_g17.t1